MAVVVTAGGGLALRAAGKERGAIAGAGAGAIFVPIINASTRVRTVVVAVMVETCGCCSGTSWSWFWLNRCGDILYLEGCQRNNSLIESLYGSSPNVSLTKSPVAKPAPGRYLLKYGVPRHPDVFDR